MLRKFLRGPKRRRRGTTRRSLRHELLEPRQLLAAPGGCDYLDIVPDEVFAPSDALLWIVDYNANGARRVHAMEQPADLIYDVNRSNTITPNDLIIIINAGESGMMPWGDAYNYEWCKPQTPTVVPDLEVTANDVQVVAQQAISGRETEVLVSFDLTATAGDMSIVQISPTVGAGEHQSIVHLNFYVHGEGTPFAQSEYVIPQVDGTVALPAELTSDLIVMAGSTVTIDVTATLKGASGGAVPNASLQVSMQPGSVSVVSVDTGASASVDFSAPIVGPVSTVVYGKYSDIQNAGAISTPMIFGEQVALGVVQQSIVVDQGIGIANKTWTIHGHAVSCELSADQFALGVLAQNGAIIPLSSVQFAVAQNGVPVSAPTLSGDFDLTVSFSNTTVSYMFASQLVVMGEIIYTGNHQSAGVQLIVEDADAIYGQIGSSRTYPVDYQGVPVPLTRIGGG